jgi:hypothetical protein
VQQKYDKEKQQLQTTSTTDGTVERDTFNNWGKWNHMKIIQEIYVQHTWKVRLQEITEDGHIGHCTHASKCANVLVQNVCHGK